MINHDCGKHLCETVDEKGRKHYPDHANISADYYLKNGGDKTIAHLIRHDMFFHTCSASELETTNLCKKDLCSLLLAALSEIHANAEMFGGQQSTSFKSKWKQIDRRGKKLCKNLFFLSNDWKKHSYVILRQDLSSVYQAVQSGHSLIEITKSLPVIDHPSLVYIVVKDEKKLKNTIVELAENGINFCLFREPLVNNSITAVATEPLDREQRKILKRFQLLK